MFTHFRPCYLSSINEKCEFREVNASQSANLLLALMLEVLFLRVVELPAELAALNLIGHLHQAPFRQDFLLFLLVTIKRTSSRASPEFLRLVGSVSI